MMNRTVKAISLLLIVALFASSLSACGGSTEPPASEPDTDPETPVEEAVEDISESEATESEISGMPEEDVVVGIVQDEIDINDPDIVLTVENCDDLKALLEGDADLDKQAAFVEKYKDRIIEFDALVFFIAQDPDYKTIYTYVLVPGEDTEHFGTTLFLLERISAMFDFHWDKETRPDSLTIGSGIRIQAKVITGDNPNYIYLKPTYTWGR